MMEIVTIFRYPRVERDIRNFVNYWNPGTWEYVFRDEDYDSEEAWADRDTWDVCCITKLGDDGDVAVPHPYDMYKCDNDADVDIREIALRIATEPGWVRL